VIRPIELYKVFKRIIVLFFLKYVSKFGQICFFNFFFLHNYSERHSLNRGKISVSVYLYKERPITNNPCFKL